MNIKDLKAFLHLSQSLHFNKTAQAVFTSPSTLSRMIQRLEQEFGQELFERDNRSVRLTPAGTRFVTFAKNVLAEWRELKKDFESNNTMLSGEITIYCTVTAAHLYLPELLEKFRQRHPLVDISLETGDVALAYQKVADKSVDFAFAVAPEKLAGKYAFLHLHHIPFKLIAPKHMASFQEWLPPNNINWQMLPFVMPESGPAKERMKSWFSKMQIKPPIHAHVSGHEAIVSMTALGCGISAVPQPVLEHSPVRDKVQVLPVAFAPKPFDLGMLCLTRRLTAGPMAEFWNLVVESAEKAR